MSLRKRLISFLTTGITIASTILSPASIVLANDDRPLISYPTGAIYSASDVLLSPGIDESNSSIQPRVASSFDITTNTVTSKYFPEIGDQGGMQSCTAFATTYYQFTYEVNKLRNIETTSSNTYSPSWTYNYLNGGINQGTNYIQAYNILYSQGALT